MRKQKTIKKSISVSGMGLHTGESVTLTFHPAPVNHGFKFKRSDIESAPIIDADADFVTEVNRGTTLEKGGVKISTVEHSLAAIVGLEIDNILIELDGPEVPILDGSSKKYIALLQEAGIEEQSEDKFFHQLKEIIKYEDVENGVELIAIPADEFKVNVMIDYNSTVLGTQHASLNSISEFKEEIADSRTFCFLHELEQLVENNLIKGGDLEHAIVFVENEVSQEQLDKLAKLLNKPGVFVSDAGYLNNVALNFENEPARHKLLDVVGDLALVGSSLNAHIIAKRPGHKANVEFAKMIKNKLKKDSKMVEIPVNDPCKEPILNINDICKLLPHRYPLLLVDKVLELSENHIVGVKNVTMNEPFFMGHFPDNPVMPGVLIVEAMAQTGGILALSTVPDPENYNTYFIKIDKTKFKRLVLPGDTLVFKLELLNPIRRGIVEMKAVAYVGDKVAAEGILMAQISKKS